MNALIVCEESQTVCKAFLAKGHNAYSNDIQKRSGGPEQAHPDVRSKTFQSIADAMAEQWG